MRILCSHLQVSHMRCIREEADLAALGSDADAGYIALPTDSLGMDVSEFLAEKGVPTSAVQLMGVLAGFHIGSAMQELQVRLLHSSSRRTSLMTFPLRSRS